MKQRRVWRYTCDHCKKSGCRKDAIRDHEACCFKNPNRRCRVCETQWPLEQLIAPMAALANIEKQNEAALIRAISDAVEGCPACILSALTQGPVPTIEEYGCDWSGNETTYSHRYYITWDYAKARDEYRNEQHSE